MSFNRLSYDTAAYKKTLCQSTGPSDYILSTPWKQCAPCFPTDPRIQPAAHGVSACSDVALVDVDSDLQGLTRKATKDPCALYKPTSGCSTKHLPDCDMPVHRAEDTRLSNPPCTLRSTGFNRWEWMCQNPQDRVEAPFDTMINSQLIVRDSHRPLLPVPIDATAALPRRGRGDAGMPPEAKSTCEPTKPVANLPTVAWRSCEDIQKY